MTVHFLNYAIIISLNNNNFNNKSNEKNRFNKNNKSKPKVTELDDDVGRSQSSDKTDN